MKIILLEVKFSDLEVKFFYKVLLIYYITFNFVVERIHTGCGASQRGKGQSPDERQTPAISQADLPKNPPPIAVFCSLIGSSG
jgi:hypothetical protein